MDERTMSVPESPVQLPLGKLRGMVRPRPRANAVNSAERLSPRNISICWSRRRGGWRAVAMPVRFCLMEIRPGVSGGCRGALNGSPTFR